MALASPDISVFIADSRRSARGASRLPRRVQSLRPSWALRARHDDEVRAASGTAHDGDRRREPTAPARL